MGSGEDTVVELTHLASQLRVTSELSMQMVSFEVLLYRISGASTTCTRGSSNRGAT
jgi:hypothetical protein